MGRTLRREAGPHLAYLVSAYPAVSHTFIAREVEALRARGIRVSTFSIRRAPEAQLLSDADRLAAAQTFAVLPASARRLLAAHLLALLRAPARYLGTLRRAWGMSAGGARAHLWQVFYFVEAIVVWRECRRRGVTHIHAHFANVASAVAMLAGEYGAGSGLRWSFTMHGPTEFDDVERFALADKVASAAFVACISEFCRSQLMKLVAPDEWGKLALVRCGLRRGDAGPPPVSRPGPPPGTLRVLCVGRLVPEKGQIILVRALASLLADGISARVTFVGDGPAAGAVSREVRGLGLAEHVELLGALGRDRVAELYREADVFCLPSFSEGVPVVLMEAMAAGLPVVTTRIAGIPELVEDGTSGALVAPGRSEPVAAALARLAGDPELRRRWGEAGAARVAHAFDVDRAAELLEELVRGMHA